jgi:hypothetical protein
MTPCRSRRAAATRAVALLSLVLAWAPGARAEPPDPAEMPALEELYQQAKAKQEEEIRRQREALRDLRQEAIDAYREKRVPIADYQTVVDILNETKDEAVQKYRRGALDALLVRFSKEDLGDPLVSVTRREIGLAVIDLMRNNDRESLTLIQELLYGWWQVKARRLQFKDTDKVRERRKAHQEMKRYLQANERD